jgi:NTE family protein
MMPLDGPDEPFDLDERSDDWTFDAEVDSADPLSESWDESSPDDPDEATADESEVLATPGVQRHGIGLCLSGGGFRATLFHLGALRRLNELGVLARVRTFSSVSGGSIAAARLATAVPWPLVEPLDGETWERLVAGPLRAFTRRNVRTGPVLAQLFNPAAWLGAASAADRLALRYQRELAPGTLADLPAEPRFVFCATDMAFGVNWEFARDRMGDYLAGRVSPHPGYWPIGRAVAASSCFPPVFNPLRVPFAPNRFKRGRYPAGLDRDRILDDVRLTDGGVYDNMGLEPVWKSHEVVLVSDGGSVFQRDPVPRVLWRRLSRYVDLADHQSRALRRRWLLASFGSGALSGAYWGIGSARSSYAPDDTTGYSKDVAARLIAGVRTDLDAFSDAEGAVLENHGYLLADRAVATHAAGLLPVQVPALRVPHPDWLDADKVEAELARSGERRMLGRW